MDMENRKAYLQILVENGELPEQVVVEVAEEIQG
jgi:hypothetical protein